MVADFNLTSLSISPLIIIVSPSKAEVKFNQESNSSFIDSAFVAVFVYMITFLSKLEERRSFNITLTSFKY